MSNVQSYNALIDRFKAFASGHFILKRFSHGQIEVSDLEKFGEYPFMHVIPSNVTYSQGMKTFSFQIVLADLPRDKEDKTEYQREVLSDLQRIAEDLIAEITNHRVLFGDLITVQNVSLEPFLEEFQHTLTGWTVSLDLLVPYYWDACSIPAEWNDFFESSTGGTGSILTFIDSITRDENGNVSLVNDEAEPAPNYYYGTNDEGVRGWYLLTDEVGLTCVTLPSCQTIIDIEAAIDLLQTDVTDLQGDVSSLETNKVPYTGATGNVDLGEYELKAGQLSLDTSPTGTAAVGTTRWNDTIGSSETTLKGGSVILKNGVDLVARVVNKVTPNTTLTKAAYQAVRISGAQGQRLAVALAQANNDTNSADTIGVVTETIATNQEGFIMTVGNLEEINTTGSLQGETWADGDVLYLSPTTAGAITNVKPTGATGHIVVIGYVEYAHAIHGKIYVKVMNGWELDELHNVYISSPANNEGLFYDSATSLWKNETIASALGYTPFNLPSLTSGSVLFSNGTTIAQDNANLFWDDTNNRLGIGTASPGVTLDVNGSIRAISGTVFSSTTQTQAIQTNSSNLVIRGSGGTAYATLFQTTGNLVLQNGGTFTDAGYKLDVNGTVRIQNHIYLASGFSYISLGNNVNLRSNIAGGAGYVVDAQSFNTLNGTNNEQGLGVFSGTYAPTSATGSPSFNGLKILPTINQTGGANGITRGLYINPTLTSAADFRAIETTNGRVIIRDTATVTGTNATSLLDLSQTWNTTGAPIAFKLNITDTASAALSDLMSLQVGGSVRFRVLKSGFFTFNTGGEIAGNLTVGGNSIDASSQLEVRSVTKGFLPPRMTTTQKNAIASPASGLVVYDTTLGKLCVRGASAWETITSV